MTSDIHSKTQKHRLGIRAKLSLSMGSIVCVMLVSFGIIFFEYNRMSTYVSGVVKGIAVCDTVTVRDTVAVCDTLTVINVSTVVSPVNIDAGSINEDLNQVYYRSLMPAMVALGVGIILVLMFLFFMNSNYVRPVYRMNEELDKYVSVGKRYNLEFDGDDQLRELSDKIGDVANENIQIRRRLGILRDEHKANQ